MRAPTALGRLFATTLLLPWLTAQTPESGEAPQRPEAPAPAEPQPNRAAPPAAAFRADMVQQLAWRNLGPVNPMGRLTDIAVHPARPRTWLVGSAGGGLWRTDNAGTTWQNVAAGFGTVSIGAIAIAPSNPDIVYVGTGEENARNSVQWGDGVYKSTDGGQTFAHIGLRETFQIGHVEVHPTDPDTVYVAALGRLWGDNEERGVYQTRDGGKNWQRVLFVDGRTGCIDVRVHGQEPNTVFACLYERKRDGFDGNDPAVRFGAASGLYKSTDAGASWRRLTTGLPSCQWGRSGIDLWAKDPDVMVAIVESERSGWATGSQQRSGGARPAASSGAAPAAASESAESERPAEAPAGDRQSGQSRSPRGSAVLGIGGEGQGGDGTPEAPGAVLQQLTEGGPVASAGLKIGDRIVKVGEEAVQKYADLLAIVQDARGGEKAALQYVRDGQTVAVDVTYGTRDTSGGMGNVANADYPNGGRLFGQLENRQDRQGPDGFETGGVFVSDDRGETWRRVNSLTERPFYYSVIRIDPRDRQNLYCVGTTLWGSADGGAKFGAIHRGIHVDFHAIWVDPQQSDHLLAACDGGLNETWDRGKTWQVLNGFCAAQYYDVVADNSVPYQVIGGLQDNGTWVGPSRTRYRDGITAADWVTIYGGDGFGAQSDPFEPWLVYATSQNGALGLVDLRSGNQARIQRDRSPTAARFNWDAPFVLSPHNRLTLYHAGNYVFRGDRYAHLDNRATRSNLTPLRNQDSLRMRCCSPALGRTEQGTATALAESPRVPGLLYVGTDDGALWRSGDGAHTWERIDQHLPILAPRYISDIVPSHFADDRVYLTLDGHRSDDFATYVFVSQDRGTTWRRLDDDLPSQEPCYAVMEDPRNENLLCLGTEYGCHVSLDRGQQWFPLGQGLPTVAVRDLFVQDRDSDLIAATHGRGVFVLDIEALRQCTAAVAKSKAHLFAVEPAILWRMQSRNLQGHRDAKFANPPYGAVFHLWLAETPAEPPQLTVHDVTGAEVAKVTGKAVAGVQAVVWDARSGQNRLAKPGTYAVKWPGQTGVEARVFELLPDPATQAEAPASSPTADRE
jgi:photosystem II stability/assembly factor-like uncharacterized protein